MFRNREIKIFLLASLAITAIGSGIVLYFEIYSFFIVWITGSFVIFIFLLFTKWRYGELMKLSETLDKICKGDYSLDIRDNREGELSILKNHLYKVTTMLVLQGEQLKEDKAKLANALSDISHQLKTPLTSMLMMTELLSQESLSADKRMEFTGIIQTQLERIEWLVTSLLKLSKIDAGTAIFKKEIINAQKLIKETTAPFLIPMELKGQSLIVEGDENIIFSADFHWTREALTNILKNCIEHTPIDGVIAVYCRENPIYTEFIIADNGCGIAKEDLPYIFQRFYRGKNAGEESIGIGLAMSKSIVQAQYGDITVDSVPGQGSCFSVKFYKQVV